MIVNNEGSSMVSSVVQKPEQTRPNGNSLPHASFSKDKTYPDNISLSSSDALYAVSQSQKDHFNNAATTIHAANKIMDDVAKVIGQKQGEIFQYEKMYPPFQNENSDKVERLKSIPGFQKQLDALTLVPDNKDLATEITNNLSDPGIKNEFFSDLEKLKIPHHDNVSNSEKNGLNIASVDMKAIDLQVRQLGRDLSTINHELGNIRVGVTQSSDSIATSISATAEGMGVEMLKSEQDARQKSEDVKQELSNYKNASIGTEQGRVLLESLR